MHYYNNNVFYLPYKKIPEEIILTSEYVKNKYSSIINRYQEISSKNAKNIVESISLSDHGDSNHINATVSLLTNKWSIEDSDYRNDLINVISKIFNDE